MATDLTQEFCALRDTYIEKQFGRLNDMQREAVFTTNGPLLILAGAGSGKTTVLVTRLGYMLCCCGIPADKILTMTYTKAATREMKQRFSALFGQDCPEIPEFRTINGVSSKIIAYYARTHGSGPAFTLMEDEGRLSKLVADLYRELNGEFASQNVTRELRKWITFVKNQILEEQEIADGQYTYIVKSLKALNDSGYTVYDGKKEITSGYVGTGMTAVDGSSSLTIVVTGDVTGDGRITITDVVKLQNYAAGAGDLNEAALKAADINGDGRVTITDVVQAAQVTVGQRTI